MAKQPHKQAGARTGANKPLHVDVKINIFHTIADAIYSTPAGKIREAVANSRDNGATWVVISLDQTNRRLSIFDNGTGISRKRFQEIFDSIGYGRLRNSSDPKLSYFGLGLMSIFKLGNQVAVFTRPQGTKELLHLEVQTGAIFDKANMDKSIKDLSQFMSPLRTVSDTDRKRRSLDLLDRIFTAEEPVSMPTSFTEILIEDIPQETIDEFSNADFRLELTQLLPLRPQDNEPFLKRFSGAKAKEVAKILRSTKYCKTVDVFFGIQEEIENGEPVPQLWKYFPRFKSNLRFSDDNVYVGTCKDADFAYYVVHTIGEDLQGDQDEGERETGFWIRNQNFLVKSSDFLDRPGPGRKPAGTIDKPLRNWVFGEVFHGDMNHILRVGRNEFLYDEPGFGEFRNAFLGCVSGPVNKAIRAVWEKRKPVIDGFVTPFAKIAEADGPIVRTQSRLRLMLGEDMPDRELYDTVKALIAERRVREIEDDSARIDTILMRKKDPLVVMEDDDALVRIIPSLPESAGTHEVRWDASSQRVVVDVSPALFKPRPVVFLAETFEVVFVAKRDTEAGVSIDLQNHRIYINPFNGDLSQFSVSILDVYIALDLADAISKTKGELKRNFLRLLGATAAEAKKYVTPLGDDLRRSAAYRG
jgi:hypothetical protein